MPLNGNCPNDETSSPSPSPSPSLSPSPSPIVTSALFPSSPNAVVNAPPGKSLVSQASGSGLKLCLQYT